MNRRNLLLIPIATFVQKLPQPTLDDFPSPAFLAFADTPRWHGEMVAAWSWKTHPGESL